jgi:GNAT superfamily N-acetyltransferase
MRMTGLAVDDVRAVSLEPFASLDATLTRQGLRFTTLADELATDSLAWEKLCAAHHAALPGWADPDPLPEGEHRERETVEEFRARTHEFGMIAEASWIAVDGDLYVGYSALTMNARRPTQAGSGGTAVRPEYRSRGIATALKARCISWAQAHGVRRLATSSGNPAMVRVNEKFGFRQTYVEVRLVRRPV